MNDIISSFSTIQDTLSKISLISQQTDIALASATEIRVLEKGTLIETLGQHIKYQFIVMSDIVRKFLTNAKGDEFTTDFFVQTNPLLLHF